MALGLLHSNSSSCSYSKAVVHPAGACKVVLLMLGHLPVPAVGQQQKGGSPVKGLELRLLHMLLVQQLRRLLLLVVGMAALHTSLVLTIITVSSSRRMQTTLLTSFSTAPHMTLTPCFATGSLSA
jgi:hypothetical protein